MSDLVGEAVAQTIQDASGGYPGAQGGSGEALSPTPASSPNGSSVDVSPQALPPPLVKHLPGGGVSWGKKLVWMEMPEGYEGMKVRVWVNYPNKFDTDIQSRDNEVMRSALKLIFLEHNGWVTPEELELAEVQGRTPIPLASPTEDQFWFDAPNELVGAMILLLNRETVKLPNSMMARNRS